MRYGRHLRRSLFATLFSFFFMVVVAIFVPGFRGAKKRANQRACFANQKTLMGAVEMYELDFNTRIGALDRPFLDALQENGYLQSVPSDPGAGEGSWQNYFLVRVSEDSPLTTYGMNWSITCLHHGFIQPPRGTTYADGGMVQLARIGIDPGRTPYAAVPIPGVAPESWLRWQEPLEEGFDLLLWVGALLSLPIFGMSLFALSYFAIAQVYALATEGWYVDASPPGAGVARVDLAAARCPVCADGFGAGTPLASMCPACQTPHHEPCLRYIGHCAVFACSRTELTERRRQEAIDEKARTATG